MLFASEEDVETDKTILFVYGTLKRGERNAFRLADQEFLGEAVTAPRYRVIDLGPHPGLIHDPATGLAICGELFAVGARCLTELDAFEGVPEAFVRERIAVEGYEEVWAYYMNTPVPEGAKSGNRWPLPLCSE
jgi:gamma-glutamylaminecyclotransferase